MERSAELHFLFPEQQVIYEFKKQQRPSDTVILATFSAYFWGLTKGNELTSPTVIKGAILII
jgi:hypothetical protein